MKVKKCWRISLNISLIPITGLSPFSPLSWQIEILKKQENNSALANLTAKSFLHKKTVLVFSITHSSLSFSLSVSHTLSHSLSPALSVFSLLPSLSIFCSLLFSLYRYLSLYSHIPCHSVYINIQSDFSQPK